jgi:hypothetical protein
VKTHCYSTQGVRSSGVRVSARPDISDPLRRVTMGLHSPNLNSIQSIADTDAVPSRSTVPTSRPIKKTDLVCWSRHIFRANGTAPDNGSSLSESEFNTVDRRYRRAPSSPCTVRTWNAAVRDMVPSRSTVPTSRPIKKTDLVCWSRHIFRANGQ